jgi:DNA repair protein RecO (recombination protein O)
MHEERTPAIVLRSRTYGESDKIVTFLTKDWGKVTGIAKGAKRSQRRFVNVLESFTHVQLRFRPNRTEELAFIFGCDLLQSFRGPSRDLRRFALANYTCELIDTMITGREAGQETYTLLLNSLQVLERNTEISLVFLPIFELFLLAHTGYAPHFTNCQQCGREALIESRGWAFSPDLGGLLCVHCRDRGGSLLLLSTDTVRFLDQTKQIDMAMALTLITVPRVAKELRALVGSILTRHLHRPLKSRAFLEQTQDLADNSVDAPPGE